MKYHLPILTGLLLALIPFWGLSQTRDSRAEYGDFATWELTRTSYSADTSAAAIILSEHAFQNPGKREVHRRIKFFNESAFEEWGTVKIRHSRRRNVLRGLKAQIVYLDEDGDKVVEKLGRGDFLKEEIVEGEFLTTINFPNLRVGAIIEYRYELSKSRISGWIFQHSIPTMWSEYGTRTSGYNKYEILKRGSVQLYVDQTTLEPTSPGYPDNQVVQRVMRNVPAFKHEPFMGEIANYLAQIEYHYSMNISSGKQYMESWEQQATLLTEEENFGGVYGRNRSVKLKADMLVAGLSTNFEKTIAIYDFVRKNIKTDESLGNYIFTTSARIKHVLDNARGSASEVNHLMLDLLGAAGIERSPAVLSTRSNGIIKMDIPSYDQFNRVVVAVKHEGVYVFLDATDADRPWNFLPTEDLNGQIYIVDEENPTFIKLSPARTYHQALLEITIDEEAMVTARVTLKDSEYAGLRLRNQYRKRYLETDSGQELFAKDILVDDLLSGEIEDVNIVNLEEEGAPLISEFTVIGEEMIQESGGFMYVPMMIFDRYERNPFTVLRRRNPVDFVYLSDEEYVANIVIPEGYQVEDLPEAVELRLLGDAAVVNAEFSKSDGVIQFRYTEKWNRAKFTRREYRTLRLFLDEVVALQDAQIVLTTISEDESDAEGDASSGN